MDPTHHQEDPVPWEVPRQDPLFRQVSHIYSWIVPRLGSPYEHQNVMKVSEAFSNAWAGWRAPERRWLAEHLVAQFGVAITLKEPEEYDWSQLLYKPLATKAGRLPAEGGAWPLIRAPTKRRLRAVEDCVAVIARDFPVARVAREWAAAFFAHERMTVNKLQRTSAAEWECLLQQLETFPQKLPALVDFLAAHDEPLSKALPTADALFLQAYDASHLAESRFERFRALLGGINSVYAFAVEKGLEHDKAAVARLAIHCASTSGPDQARAFAAEPLQVQVSAVDLARDILFDAFAYIHGGKCLLEPDRVVAVLSQALPGLVSHHPGLDAQARTELVAACAGDGRRPDEFMVPSAQGTTHGQQNTHHGHPHRPQPPPSGSEPYASLGAARQTRYFPEARRAGW